MMFFMVGNNILCVFPEPGPPIIRVFSMSIPYVLLFSCIKGIIPFWILAILTLKELIMITVAFVLYKRKVITVHSMWYGKVATILFFLAIVCSLLSKELNKLSVITIYFFYIAIIMTLFAGIMYAKKIIFSLRNKESYSS